MPSVLNAIQLALIWPHQDQMVLIEGWRKAWYHRGSGS